MEVAKIPNRINDLFSSAQGLAEYLAAHDVGVVSVDEATAVSDGQITLALAGHHVQVGDGYAVLVRESVNKTGFIFGKCRVTSAGVLYDVRTAVEHFRNS